MCSYRWYSSISHGLYALIDDNGKDVDDDDNDSDWAFFVRIFSANSLEEWGGGSTLVGGQICTQRIPRVHTFDILARGGGHGGSTETEHPLFFYSIIVTIIIVLFFFHLLKLFWWQLRSLVPIRAAGHGKSVFGRDALSLKIFLDYFFQVRFQNLMSICK